jgi:hypothetical protein
VETLLDAAWRLPVAAIYRGTRLEWQKARALCGPTSIANALRSFGGEVDRDSLLDDTGLTTFFGYRLAGMTLDQLAAVVEKKSARRATVLRDLGLDELRRHLAQANEPARRYIVNFHRGAAGGSGGGHHSPIGGYLVDADRALVLDVNRRIGPTLVSTERLHAGIDAVDPATGRRRGLLLIE